MTITFFSNYLTHHQLPFSLEMQKLLGDNYCFVSTVEEEKDRFAIGYHEDEYTFNLKSYKSLENLLKAQKLADESDIVIIGSAPAQMISRRIKERKIILRYSERLFKRGRLVLLNPRIALSYIRLFLRSYNWNGYLLCASAYAALDYNMVGLYRGKCFKWGYFPLFVNYNVEFLRNKKQNDQMKLLWTGRFIGWKHPEKALEVALYLKKKGYEFTLTMIGAGEKINKIEKLITKFGLNNQVILLGSMFPDKVRAHMEDANIFLFTSSQQEGWGAVLNEAMNSGCAVVASDEIGSVPYLVKDCENGFIYRNNSTEELCKKVEQLIIDKELREKFSKNAFHTISEEWNAEIAARKLYDFCNNLLKGNDINIFNDGILSKDYAKY